jgi:hypothetical protein
MPAAEGVENQYICGDYQRIAGSEMWVISSACPKARPGPGTDRDKPVTAYAIPGFPARSGPVQASPWRAALRSRDRTWANPGRGATVRERDPRDTAGKRSGPGVGNKIRPTGLWAHTRQADFRPQSDTTHRERRLGAVSESGTIRLKRPLADARAFERSRWRGRRYACSLVEAFSGTGLRWRSRRGNLLSDAP